MSTFDSYKDSPLLIRTEGQEISLSFERDPEDNSKGIVSWNIPTPAHGCTADTQAYCGIVVTLSTKHRDFTNERPENGTLYTADATADPDLHVGGSIGNQRVIGAFYNDKTTTSMVVSDLQPNVAYFVQAYAVDCTLRYHADGVHAYSLNLEDTTKSEATSAFQVVLLNGEDGVKRSAATGLVPGHVYTFTICIDHKDYTIQIKGEDALMYGELVDAINKQFQLLINPPSSANPPMVGVIYLDESNKQLYQWDGHQYEHLILISQLTDPTTIPVGTYWYDNENDLLKSWNGASWDTHPFVNFNSIPSELACESIWFNGTDAYFWTGSTWVSAQITIQENDPQNPFLPQCGTVWYATDTQILYVWNNDNQIWDDTTAIVWGQDPNALGLSTLWFNTETNELFEWNGAGWNTLNLRVDVGVPSNPVNGDYFLDVTTNELSVYNGTTWEPRDFLAHHEDPTVRESGDYWWNTVTDQILIWDAVHSNWDQIPNFIQQAEDPSCNPPQLTPRSLWYKSSTGEMFMWDGVDWILISFIDYPTDPLLATYWKTDTSWYMNSGGWTEFYPISDVLYDPGFLPVGIYWLDESVNEVKRWNGAVWLSIAVVRNQYYPTEGEFWFNTTTNTLMQWIDHEWQPAVDVPYVELNADGNLKFVSGIRGSLSTLEITSGDNLFDELNVGAIFDDSTIGMDGLTTVPSYAQLGVGDDGSPDERRELMDSIRAQLGYPVVQVELTKYQLDTAITAALESLRKRSSSAYKRKFYFLKMKAGVQSYDLVNEYDIAGNKLDFHKIVNVTAIYRMSSSFLSSLHMSQQFGQAIIQQLYTVGSFDLVSYDLATQYTEMLEHLTAARMTYYWDETQRRLLVYNYPYQDDVVLLDTTVERTEQQLLADRWLKGWIEKYAKAEAMRMLAQIRGKYATLPGAGGGVTLNAAELMTQAETDQANCYQQLDEYHANSIDDYGMDAHFVIG